MIMLIRFVFDNLYNFIIESLKVECVRYNNIRTHLLLFSQYTRIDRVDKKFRRFFEGLFFDRRVVFEYLLNGVFFRRLLFEFRAGFLRLRIRFEHFRRFTFLFDEVNHEICGLYIIITSNGLISLRAIYYRSIEDYKGSWE